MRAMELQTILIVLMGLWSCVVPAPNTKVKLNESSVRVQWGDALLTFHEIHGLGAQLAVTSYRDSTAPDVVRKVPLERSYPDFVLSRAQSESLEFWQWIATTPGSPVHRDLTLTLLSPDGHAIARYRAKGCLPLSVTVETGPSGAPSAFIERLEIATEGVERIQ